MTYDSAPRFLCTDILTVEEVEVARAAGAGNGGREDHRRLCQGGAAHDTP